MPGGRTPTNVPKWWIDEVERVMAERGWSRADLARKIAGTDDPDSQAFKNAKPRISRFLNQEATTIEVADEIREAIREGLGVELRDINFIPETPDEADGFAMLQANRQRLHRALMIDRLLEAAAAGSTEEAERLLKDMIPQLSPSQGDEQQSPSRPKTGRHR